MRNLVIAPGSRECAEVSVRSCLLHCARGAGIYLPSCVAPLPRGIQGLPWRAAAGAVAHQETGGTGRAVAPARCWAPGTCCFTSLSLSLCVCKTGGTIIPEQPNPRGCILSLR